MAQPIGFVTAFYPSHIFKLYKVIYGLHQASRARYTELKSYILTSGFKGSISYYSLFVHSTHSSLIFVLVYLDDIIVTGPSPTLI